MSFSLHFCNKLFKVAMSLVDLMREIREISVQVDFRTRKSSVAGISTHIEQLHPTFLEFGEHQMSHFVRSELWEVERISNAVEKIFDGPFRDGAAWVALGVREKNETVRITTVARDESSTILLNVLLETSPRGVGEDNGSCQFVLRHPGSDGDGMSAPVNIIDTEQYNLFPTKRPVMRKQHNGLVPYRTVCEDMC